MKAVPDVPTQTVQSFFNHPGWALVALVFCCVGLRLINISQAHSDETTIVDSAALMVLERSPFSHDRDFFDWPAHSIMYINAAVFPAVSRLVYGLPFAETYPRYSETYFKTARSVSIFFSVGLVLVAYLLGAAFHRVIGVMNATFFTVSIWFITYGRIARPDIPLVFFSLACAYMLVLYIRRKNLRLLAAAAFFAGMSVSVKYTGLLDVCLVLAAPFIAMPPRRRDLAQHVLLAAGVAAVTVVAAAPYLLLDFPTAWAQFMHESQRTNDGMRLFGWWGNMKFYLGFLASAQPLIAVPLAVLGWIWLLRTHGRSALPLAHGCWYFIGQSLHPLHWRRWLTIMLPAVFIGIAAGLYVSCEWIETRLHGLSKIIAYVVWIGLTVAVLTAY